MISIYIHTPLDNTSRIAKNECLRIINEALYRGIDTIVCGDFNQVETGRFVKQIKSWLAYTMFGDENGKRTKGVKRTVDFIFPSQNNQEDSARKLLGFYSFSELGG